MDDSAAANADAASNGASSPAPVQKIILKQSSRPWQSWGWGGFKGKGKGWSWESKPPQSVADDFEIDETVRHKGSVNYYQKFKGYGFLELVAKGIVPGDKVFVHWRDITTQDRFPQLIQGMEVEFSITKYQDKRLSGGTTLRAKNVSQVGGEPIALQDDLDATKKTFVGGQHLRYTGNLKFYDPMRCMGWVALDTGFDIDPKIPQELKVEQAEVNCGGDNPPRMENLQVEFGIWQTPRGDYKVYNMTLPGGVPISVMQVENRQVHEGVSLTGKVQSWSSAKGYGFVAPDHPDQLPALVVTKLMETREAAEAKGRPQSTEKVLYFRKSDVADELHLTEGDQVTFEVYTDDKGAGACNIRK